MNGIAKWMNGMSGMRAWKRLWIAALVLIMLSVPSFAGATAREDRSRYMEAFDLINRLHVSGQAVEADKYETIEEMIASLKDPYTVYLDEEMLKQFTNAVDMNYPGIGMRLGQDEGGFVAVEIFGGSPAEAAGLKRGDYIIAVNGTKTKGLALHEVTAGVRGPEGTSLMLTIRRDGREFDVRATRQAIRLPVVSGGMMDGGIGYLAVSSFSDDADEQFAVLMSDLKKRGMKGLVLDVRDNPGGFLETARQMARQFRTEGILIHTSDKNKQDNPVTFANGTSVTFPVAVLVNENSASASEVLAGALQDYEIATLIGQKTYGKGSVQAMYQLKSGGVLKLTVEEYSTPSKRVVNLKGIEPDVFVDGNLPQLIAALRSAGQQELRLELLKHSYRLNGIEFFDDLPLRTIDGVPYVKARTLAAFTGLSIAWNEQLHGVDVAEGESTRSFSPDTGFRIEHGTGYIELSAFRSQFPQLEVSESGSAIILALKGKGL